MLHQNMNMSYLMVHDQHAEDNMLCWKNKEAKRIKSYDGGSSKGRFEIQDKLDSSIGYPIKFLKISQGSL